MEGRKRRNQDEKGSHGIVSLFVENLPEQLHWKGLWHSFARHGDVVNVYIERKRSRRGRRFGFVRMKNKEDAERVIERLQGFYLYGSKLSVKVASKSDAWKGYPKGRNQTGRAEQFGKRNVELSNEYKAEVRLDMKPANTKHVFGHIENEELWKLRKCLVGVMDSVCSVSNIHNRLLNWGFGDINVQRLGAKSYLLTFMDEDLAEMLEDVNWSYLREIFSDVQPWSEQVSFNERATWLEIRGLPLHCWNGVSLKRIADCWGAVKALGVNANHTHDCEKVTVLISTKYVPRIEKVIEVEIGEKMFPVYVREVGFSDGTSYPLCNNWNKGMGEVEEQEETKSNSNSNLEVKESVAVDGDRSSSGTEGEALEAMCAEKENIISFSREMEISRALFIESELMGGVSKGASVMFGKEETVMDGKEERQPKKQLEDESRVEKETGDIQLDRHKVGVVEKMGLEDIRADEWVDGLDEELGNQLDPIFEEGEKSNSKVELKTKFLEGFKDKKVEPKRSWANVVDDIVNSGQFQCWNDKENSFLEAEIEIEPFNDFLERKGKRNKKKAKKFGSLLEIQNKILTESERRKRDRALKRRNWSKHLLEESELSGKSLLDIDISNRVSNLVKEAKQDALKSKPEEMDLSWEINSFGLGRMSMLRAGHKKRQLHNVLLDASQAKGSVEEMNFRTVFGSRRKKLGILEVPYSLEEMHEVVWSREETNRQA
ncbi:hypothetical protein GQ457_08G019930 [Hibiscus cannabinus]